MRIEFLDMFRKRGVVLLISAMAAVAGQLKADLVTFTGNNGTGSVTVPGYYITFITSPSGSCVGSDPYTCTSSSGNMMSVEFYDAPLADSSTTLLPIIYVGGAAGNVTGEILTTISDNGSTCGNPPGSINCPDYFTGVHFQYDVGLAGPSCTSVTGGCIPYEPGIVQQMGTISYGPNSLFAGTMDLTSTTVDFEYTPEPSLLIPLALGLGLTGFVVRKRSIGLRG